MGPYQVSKCTTLDSPAAPICLSAVSSPEKESRGQATRKYSFGGKAQLLRNRPVPHPTTVLLSRFFGQQQCSGSDEEDPAGADVPEPKTDGRVPPSTSTSRPEVRESARKPHSSFESLILCSKSSSSVAAQQIILPRSPVSNVWRFHLWLADFLLVDRHLTIARSIGFPYRLELF